MKRVPILAVTIAILMVLVGCKSSSVSEPVAMLPNPIVEMPVQAIAQEAGLRAIDLDGVEFSVKINTDTPIYSIEVDADGIRYNVRISKIGEGTDISGVYLGGNISSAIYDSADSNEAPSVTVESDSNYIKAYGYWNGYSFSISTDARLTSAEMAAATFGYICRLISTSNIL